MASSQKKRARENGSTSSKFPCGRRADPTKPAERTQPGDRNSLTLRPSFSHCQQVGERNAHFVAGRETHTPSLDHGMRRLPAESSRSRHTAGPGAFSPSHLYLLSLSFHSQVLSLLPLSFQLILYVAPRARRDRPAKRIPVGLEDLLSSSDWLASGVYRAAMCEDSERRHNPRLVRKTRDSSRANVLLQL